MPRNGNNADAAARALERAILAGQQEARRALAGIGNRIVADIRVSLSSPAAPSPPGTPPARRSGALAESYRSDPGRDAKGRPYVAVSSTMPGAPVAAFQEFGTSTSPARPHLRPAVARAVPTISPTLGKAWASGVKRGAKGGGKRR